jgi:hypothetical protein
MMINHHKLIDSFEREVKQKVYFMRADLSGLVEEVVLVWIVKEKQLYSVDRIVKM